MIEFNEFASMLAPVLSKGSSTVAFTNTLFEAILPEDRYDLIEGLADDTFKSYYNGKTSITALAKKISADIETENFAEFITDHGEKAVQKLCQCFANVLPGITINNAGKMLAELFERIIMEAASAKRRKNEKFQAEEKVKNSENDAGVKGEAANKSETSGTDACEEKLNGQDDKADNEKSNHNSVQFVQTQNADSITNNNFGEFHGNFTIHMA